MRINSEDELVKKVFSVQAAFIKLMATSVKKKSHNDDDVMGLTSVQFKLNACKPHNCFAAYVLWKK